MLNKFVTLDIESRDSDGNSLLNYAVQMGNYTLTEHLIKKGANINTQNNKKNTPLHNARQFQFPKIFSFLIE